MGLSSKVVALSGTCYSSFMAEIKGVRTFDECYSIFRLLIDRNPNFQRFAVFLVRGILIRPFPDLASLDDPSESRSWRSTT